MRPSLCWSSLAAALLLVTTAPLSAQRLGTIELGGYTRYTYFDLSLDMDHRVGAGTRVGVHLSPRFQLSADYLMLYRKSQTPPNRGTGTMHYAPAYARLLYHQPIGESRFALVAGAGAVRNSYDNATRIDYGVASLAGVRMRLVDRLLLRVEGTIDYVPNPANALATPGVVNNDNYGVGIGVSYLLGDLRRPERAPVEPVRPKSTDVAVAIPAAPTGVGDADRDGVADDRDICLGTAMGETVDARGCPPPKDSDRDGVLDDQDVCPDTPLGSTVEPNGCLPPRDTDADGVIDTDDACADTPAGSTVDAAGCVPFFAAGEEKRTVTGIVFIGATATLSPKARPVLDSLAQRLLVSNARVEIAAHTDSRGGVKVNRRVSTARANAIRTYLMEKGVPGERLVAQGYGPDQPVASNKTVKGRAQNRRIEVRRLP